MAKQDRDQAEADFIAELHAKLPADFRPKGNLFVFVDEAHRTQTGKMHAAMKQLLPEAMFIGFTGTPLLKRDRETSIETFGSFIHTYKFDEAVDDGASWQETLHDAYLELKDEFGSVWSGLDDAERRTLAAIAISPDPLKKKVLEDLQLARSTARDARDRLVEGGYVHGEPGGLELVDPLLALWVLNGRQGLVESSVRSAW